MSSGVGFRAARVPDHRHLFSEAPSRVVLCVEPDLLTAVERAAETASVPMARIGVATGDVLSFKDLLEVSLDEASANWNDRLPGALAGGNAQS